MVFNTTFNNISITLYIVAFCLIGGETRVPRENNKPAASHWQSLSHVVLSTPCHERDSNS